MVKVFKRFLRRFFLDRSFRRIVLVAVSVVIIPILIGWYIGRKEDGSNSFSDTLKRFPENLFGEQATERDGKIERYLDGVFVEKEQENKQPVGVMIENMTTVRPQSGLNSAQIVYEALVEGGITRFMAVFTNYNEEIKEIGPVRSARTYFTDWAEAIDAVYMHAGGDQISINEIPKKGVKDMDALHGGKSRFFWRDLVRPAPHNLYTKSELIARAVRDSGFEGEGKFPKWKFQDDEKLSDPKVKHIRLDYSGANYTVDWYYSIDENTYHRTNGGKEHVDRNSEERIRAKNVLVIRLDATERNDDKNRLRMVVNGEGDAVLYRDGDEIRGRWKKENFKSRMMVFDEQDNEMKFNRGTTWIQYIPYNKSVTVD